MNMQCLKSPTQVYKEISSKIKSEWKTAFFSTLILGLCIHMPILLSDIPNHDGLSSMYFNQNMITSGRWFLMFACGISTFYTLPWVIGLFAIIYLALSSVVLTEFLGIQRKGNIILISGLLVSFPAIASTFVYVFTMDGYMLGMLLALLAPLCVKKIKKFGFLAGGICLAFSLGIYQAYLPFAILLSLYAVVMILISTEQIRQKIKQILSYLYMGVIGVSGYYVILQILLFFQGKELDTYQGINGVGQAKTEGLFSTISRMYYDFFAFTVKGNVFFENAFSFFAMLILGIFFLVTLGRLVFKKKCYKRISFYVFIALFLAVIPISVNVILLISPSVTYHLLMRYQWVLFPICVIGLIEQFDLHMETKILSVWKEWGILICASVLILNYALVDNIAYSNLQKKYEKTYAYCLRLLDRIEQTEGYYQGMPVAMIGVVSDEQYPNTDITGDVTSNMIGIPGDWLLYTRTNYQAFFKNYMGATIQLVSDEEMLEIYDSKEYQSLESFPGRESMKVVDGILYIKLENQE